MLWANRAGCHLQHYQGSSDSAICVMNWALKRKKKRKGKEKKKRRKRKKEKEKKKKKRKRRKKEEKEEKEKSEKKEKKERKEKRNKRKKKKKKRIDVADDRGGQRATIKHTYEPKTNINVFTPRHFIYCFTDPFKGLRCG